ncbi:MAG: heme-dependent peroxidase [Bryobacterales bacterium]|nr:heme-dependent peroxidase [Bryobacterales bacterium]
MAMPAVPYTLDGAATLHQMLRFHWDKWHAQPADEREAIVAEASEVLGEMEATGKSAIFSLLGHRGDLMVLHFRDSFDALNEAEMRVNSLRLRGFLEVSHSYLSVVELGLYASTSKIHADLAEKGFAPHSPEWEAGAEDVLDRQRKAMAPRLWPDVPPHRYCCFYPMDRKRGEEKNWYVLPLADRQRMMHEHGLIGRRYQGAVKQIISGSIGFDNWEWGVDLFADDPLVFKKLIYEMRFDEVSAIYALFGDFYVGLRFGASQLGEFFAGKSPTWEAPPVEDSSERP